MLSRRDTFINRALLSPAPTLLLSNLVSWLVISLFPCLKASGFYQESHFKGAAKTSLGNVLVHLFKPLLPCRTE